MVIIKKTDDIKCWQECEKTVALIHCWWQRKMAKPLKKIIWKFLKRININLTYDLAILLKIVDMFYNMDKPQKHYSKCKKPET